MIPKVIHYCWFGGNPKSEIINRCIESWKTHCHNYEIKEWNESNWDIDQYPYAREAYDAGKWAFVSDIARLHVLYTGRGVLIWIQMWKYLKMAHLKSICSMIMFCALKMRV